MENSKEAQASFGLLTQKHSTCYEDLINQLGICKLKTH
jgi:hypothetical protein